MNITFTPHHGRREAGRSMGRAAIAAAVLAAILICCGLTWFLLPGRVAGPQPPAADPAPVAAVPQGDGDRPASAPEAGVPVEQSPAASADAVQPVAGTPQPAALRIFGTVSDPKGNPIAGASVRWVPASLQDVEQQLHDGRAFEARAGAAPSPKPALDPERHRTAASGEAGAYELVVPLQKPAGVLLASSPGHESRALEVEPPEGASEVQLDLQLGPAGSIAGKISSQEDGAPAAGMIVSAGNFDPDSPALFSFGRHGAIQARSGADGTYLLQGLPPGHYRVSPQTGDSLYLSIPSSKAKKVDLEAAAEVDGVDFRVELGGRIYGRVDDPEGKPAAGARCNLIPDDLMENALRGELDSIQLVSDRNTKTDADGRYEIRGLPRGKKYRVAAGKKGAAGASSAPEILQDEDLEINLKLTLGSTVRGKVVKAGGGPAAGVEVNCLPDMAQAIWGGNFPGNIDMEHKAATEDDGAFVLEHIGAGEYTLRTGAFNPQAAFFKQPGGKTIQVDGTNDVDGVILTLEDAPQELAGNRSIQGLVLDPLGKPVKDAAVQAMTPQIFGAAPGGSATTDSSGRFTIAVQTGDRFQLSAMKSGYSRATLEVEPGTPQPIAITLQPFGRVSGRVLLMDGSPPGPGGKVKALPAGPASPAALFERITIRGGEGAAEAAVDEGGAFSLPSPPGTVEILAMIPGFAPARSKPVEVTPASEAGGIEIRISKGAVVQGRVVRDGPGGRTGVAGAAVHLKPGGASATEDFMSDVMPQLFGSDRNKTQTDENGFYELAHLAEGEYTLSAIHPDYAPSDPAAVALQRDQVWKAPVLVVAEGASLAVKVLFDGKAKPGMMLQLIGGKPLKQAVTREDGTYKFTGLSPGEYAVNIMDLAAMQTGKMAIKTRTVKLEGSGLVELEVVFGVGHKITGTVKGAPPGPMRFIQLRRPGGQDPEKIDPTDTRNQLEAAKYQAGMSTIAEDGAYEIADIEPGKYILEIPKLPANITDLEAYKKMDRTPSFRKEIEVGNKDVEVDIVVR